MLYPKKTLACNNMHKNIHEWILYVQRYARACSAVHQAWCQLCMVDVVEKMRARGVHLVACNDPNDLVAANIKATCVQRADNIFEVHFTGIHPRVIDRHLGLIYEECFRLPPCKVSLGKQQPSPIVKLLDGSIILTLTDDATGVQQPLLTSIHVRF